MVSISGLVVHSHGSGWCQEIIKGAVRFMFKFDCLNMYKMHEELETLIVNLGEFTWHYAGNKCRVLVRQE